MTFLDTHVHVWNPEQLNYPWLTGTTALDAPLLPHDYRADGGAGQVVFVQAGSRPDQSLDEAQWVGSLDWPELAGIVAAADLRSPQLGQHLDALGEIAGVVGIRHLLHSEGVQRFADPALRRGLGMLADRDLTFDACIKHHQLPALIDLLEGVPTLRVVLDHLGKPPLDDGLGSEAGQRWADGIGRLAARGGTHVKLSGLPAETKDAPAYVAHADDFLRRALDAFGPERAMLGSDWPVSSRLAVPVAPDAWTARVREATALGDADWRLVSTETGARFYGIATQADANAGR